MSHEKLYGSSAIIISAQDLIKKMDQVPDLIIINVLDEQTYADCHIPGSINIPYDHLVEITSSWDKSKELVVYCAQFSCPMSKQASVLLADLGFTHIYEYSGGIKDWYKKGFDTLGACTQKYLHE
ncbi:MAG TPA: rhodanese-like domain-containing protein [Candidatus Saccharimonadales bacterium]|nr:rhodanese-like domain-containing protein [Candidatus Saccharimonadales bacterium]